MPLKSTTDDSLQLNLTPMIDVVFLLVIFFMAATQFTKPEKSLDLELPTVTEGGASTNTQQKPSVVAITAEGKVTLDGRPLSLADLETDLRTLAADRPRLEVLVEADARSDFQHVAAAMAACRAAGVVELGVSVETTRVGSQESGVARR